MPDLGVNIDHIASIRQLRQGLNPQPAQAALLCEKAGADSIVAHLREDRRHIQDKDLFVLRKIIRTRLNLEMSVASDIVRIALMLRPDQATIVPERRKEITTEGGLDVVSNKRKLAPVIKELESQNIPVSLFIDPDKTQIETAVSLGVLRIELHTGRYADARNGSEQSKYLDELKKMSRFARSNGLRVFAGHGLDYDNVKAVAAIKGIEELNIGYSIVCRAALVGICQAVKEMKALLT